MHQESVIVDRIQDVPSCRELRPEEFSVWDAFVHRHPHGSPYHLSSWKTALEAAFPHIRGRFLVLNRPGANAICAGLPVYTVKSRILGNRLVSVPFAAYCDPLVENASDVSAFLANIRRDLAEAGAGRYELKTWRFTSIGSDSTFQVAQRYLHHFIPLDADPADLFRRFSATSVRHMIAKAPKHAVAVCQGHGAPFLDAFHRIHVETRVRLGLPPLPRILFESLTSSALPNPATLHFAFLRDQPVAAILSLRFRDMVAIEFAGDLPEHRKSGANQWLYWELLREACLGGYKWLSLGRTGLDSPGLRAYKLHWNAREEELCTRIVPGTSVGRHRHPFNGAAHKLSRICLRVLPRRLVTRFGEFCYRHLG
jgi:hypothetical protein